ncbi:MAG TPA: hypothetical protein ACFYD2_06110 [Candidatus Avalokitesvara rifleensis]|uniref:hypothetical protein n=1 Tax=Candidatus Avalokitesvara rifleensis TaxID=3367620 RepID=UPI004026AAB8
MSMEEITMYAQIVIAIASGVLAAALWWHRSAVLLQKRTLETSLFADFYNRANEILAKEEDYKKDMKTAQWCLLFLNHLEYLACLANKGYISLELVKPYKGRIDSWYDEYLVRQKDALRGHYHHHPEAFSELHKLHETLNTGGSLSG